MIRGFAISTLVHASVLAMAMMSWPQADSECDRAVEKLRRENPGIRAIEIMMALPECAAAADLPIDFEDVGLVSNVSELRKAPEPQEDAVAPPEPEVDEVPPEPEPEAAEPEPEEEVPDPRAEPEPEPKKPEPKKPEPKKPDPLIKKDPPKTPKKDDLDFLNDLDKALQDKRQERGSKTAAADDRPVLGNAERDRDGVGDRTGDTGSLSASLARQISYCTRDNSDLPKEDQIDVDIRVQLNLDGSLASPAVLVSPRSRPVGRSGMVVDVALRAVRKCAPYKLPPEAYEDWKDILVTIRPPSN
jgi:outer membrane biosynthesis protein TonB